MNPARVSLSGLLLALFGQFQPALADSWFAAVPPLSREERRSYAVGSSQGICEADMFEYNPGMDALVARPIRWLRGAHGSEPIRVHVDAQRSGRGLEVGLTPEMPRRALLFLHAVPDAKWWSIADSPYGLDRGIVGLSDSAGRAEVALVEAEIRRQSLDSLAMASDLVVLAHTQPREAEPKRYRRRFQVDSVIAGQYDGRVIEIVNRMIGELKDGRSLIFLKRGEGGDYMVTRTGASCRVVRDGVVQGFDRPLAKVIRAVQAARQKQPS